jgi:signal peptidase I
MNPTVIDGDRVFVDKRAYGIRIPFTLTRVIEVADPRRGDVVVLESPDSGITLLKRVIAVPGDTVAMHDEGLIINGVAAHYEALPPETGDALLSAIRALKPVYVREELPGVSHATMRLPQLEARRNFAPITIPAGRYLVMGDNRDNSHDSRYFGLVKRDAIFGRATRVVVSLDPEHFFLPRAGRWLSPAL